MVFSDQHVVVVFGDLSDIDNSLALEFFAHLYNAKHGFTIVFVNNLPAYVNVLGGTNREEELGRGFTYGSNEVHKQVAAENDKYATFMQSYVP